jgi:hypothetical protein
MKKYWPFVVLVFVAVIGGSCGKKSGESSQATSGETAVGDKSNAGASDSGTSGTEKSIDDQAVAQMESGKPRMGKVSTKLVKRWMLGLTLRHPGMDARKGVQMGGGAMGVKATPTAMSWYEMADIDSNGTQEKVGFMWDSNDKVMYAYTLDPVRLDDGTMAKKGLVVGQFAEGNTAKRQQGSGFWAYATTRDTLSYRLVTGSLYGCRFDQYGRTTECGPGKWTRDNNNFSINTKVK